MITFLPKIITYERKKCSSDVPIAMEEPPFTRKTKFEVYGEEMIQKEGEVGGIPTVSLVYAVP